MKIAYFQTSWGFAVSGLERFLDRVRESGYDGAEVFMPDAATGVPALARDRGLELLGHIYSHGTDWREHVRFQRDAYLRAIECGPTHVNSQTGRDHFSFDDNLRIFAAAEELVRQHRVPIHHETHRARPTFSVPGALRIVEALPDITLTADVSHWMVVHESDLRDQEAAVDAVLARARHVHARVGHPEGPQVPDPSDPAWDSILERHLELWRRIATHVAAAGGERLTVTTEFGPAPYLANLPHTTQPVADQWQINVFVRDRLRERLAP